MNLLRSGKWKACADWRVFSLCFALESTHVVWIGLSGDTYRVLYDFEPETEISMPGAPENVINPIKEAIDKKQRKPNPGVSKECFLKVLKFPKLPESNPLKSLDHKSSSYLSFIPPFFKLFLLTSLGLTALHGFKALLRWPLPECLGSVATTTDLSEAGDRPIRQTVWKHQRKLETQRQGCFSMF